MTATRARRVPAGSRDPQADPTRVGATANAAGRAPGTAAAGQPVRRQALPERLPDATRSAARQPARRQALPARLPEAARQAARQSTFSPSPPRTRTGRSATASAGPARRSTSATSAMSAASAAPRTAAIAAATAAQPRTQPQPQPQTRPERRTPLRVVGAPDPDARSRRRRRVMACVLAGLACAGLFAIVGVRVLLAQGQGPVDGLEAQVTNAQADNQRLRLDVARLESPSRIVAEAKSRLAMAPPAAVIYLSPLSQSSPAQSSPVQPAG